MCMLIGVLSLHEFFSHTHNSAAFVIIEVRCQSTTESQAIYLNQRSTRPVDRKTLLKNFSTALEPVLLVLLDALFKLSPRHPCL